jgi:hypothetical protein
VRHRRIVLGAFVALFLVLGLGPVPVASASDAAPASGKDPAALAASLRDGRAPRDDAALQAAATTGGGDTRGEASNCKGDIDSFAAAYEQPSGAPGPIVLFGTKPVCANDPQNDPAWVVGWSGAGWGVDVNGDAKEDFYAVFGNDGSGLFAGLFNSAGTPVCGGAPIVESGVLFAGFDAQCLGSPASFRIYAELVYDLDPNASAAANRCVNCTYDAAPNTGWGPVTVLGSGGAAPAPAPAPAGKKQGYWMVARNGAVFSFGDAPHLGDVQGMTQGMEAVDLEPAPSLNGYWVVTNTGNVYGFRDSGYYGGLNGQLTVGETVTSLSSTSTGKGYWLFTNKGRVAPFGDAKFLGDMSGSKLNGPVLDSIPTPTGQGYYMVASDGGIFTFGDAQFIGSMGGTPLNSPVQSLVPDPDGTGYWLVASDGGIFAFEGSFYGSMGDQKLNRPVTGMVGFGKGYLMVGEDGGIFAFGDAPFFGSLGDNPPPQPIVSVAIMNSGG